jgi:predicted Zn-ribbon and HTH transcriptional regulator
VSMAEITLKGYKCERCGHVWVPREHERPRVCPKCKSAYWDKARRIEVKKQEMDFKEKRKAK